MNKIIVERKLTMEEKRKLEKMMFADIEEAERVLSAKRRQMREGLEASVVKNASATVKAAFRKWQVSKKAMSQASKQIEALGYRINSYGEDGGISVGYGKHPEAIVKFDNETSGKQRQFTELKRSFAIQLFGGGVESQKLFANLAKEIARISR